MSISSGRAQLANAFKNLEEHWDETQRHWRDAVRADYAEHHWQPLATQVSAVLTAMDSLDQVLGRMRQDCGDEGEVL